MKLAIGSALRFTIVAFGAMVGVVTLPGVVAQSCSPSAPCAATLDRGQRLSIGSFTVAHDDSPNPFAVSFDGAQLRVTIGGPFGVRIVQAPPGAGCARENGLLDRIVCASPVGTLTFGSIPPNPGGSPCLTKTLPAGWNLVDGGIAAELTTNRGPLYTYRPGAPAYRAVRPDPSLSSADGYWALFDQATEVFLGCGSPPARPMGTGSPVTITVSPGWTMVGNPLSELKRALVGGADALFVYLPGTGYQQTDALVAGQGAFLYSASGGDVTFAPQSAPQ